MIILHEHCSYAMVTCICFDDELFTEIWQLQHWCGEHCLFESKERCGGQFSPNEPLLLQEIVQRTSNDVVVFDKLAIVACET